MDDFYFDMNLPFEEDSLLPDDSAFTINNQEYFQSDNHFSHNDDSDMLLDTDNMPHFDIQDSEHQVSFGNFIPVESINTKVLAGLGVAFPLLLLGKKEMNYRTNIEKTDSFDSQVKNYSATPNNYSPKNEETFLSTDFSPSNSDQWFMVFLCEPNTSSEAAKLIINNYNRWDRRTKDLDFFILGYSSNTDSVIKKFGYLPDPIIQSRRLGNLYFDENDFFDSIEYIESKVPHYHYHGECEFLLMKYDSTIRDFDFNNVFAYNLDDIVRNKVSSVEAFLETVIELANQELDMDLFKHSVDETYYKAIMPDFGDNALYFQNCEAEIEKILKDKDKFVFISYSTKNRDQAFQLKDYLESHKINVWIAPNDIPVGTSYAYTISEVLKRSFGFMLLLTKESVKSIWVAKEVDRAINNKLKIFILNKDCIIDELPSPFNFYLCDVQSKYCFEEFVQNKYLITNVLK